MNVEIGTEAAQLPEKEYINRIFVCSAAGVIDCHYRLPWQTVPPRQTAGIYNYTYNSVHRSHMEAINVNIPSAFRAPNLFCDTKCMTSSNFYSIFCMAESYTPISLSC